MSTSKDLTFLPTCGLTALMRAGELSPVELLETCLERIAHFDPQINAFVLVLAEAARAQARDSEERFRRHEERSLEGIPIAIKDNTLLAGARMTLASRLAPPWEMTVDADLVARLRQAGAVFVGKTNLPEFGTIPTTEGELFGPSRNPWDPERTAGGSSGGSAAAVAAGLVPAAHGNDGGGSLRIPAACCGLFTVKPSRGRVPHGPVDVETVAALTVDGFLTRTVGDNARLLDVVRGRSPGDLLTAPEPPRPYAEEVDAPPGRLRIAWTLEAPFPVPVQAAQADAVRDCAALCERLGHDVEEAAPAWRDDDIVVHFMQVWATLIGSTVELLAELGGDPGTAEAHNRALHELGDALSANVLGVTLTRLQGYSRRVVAFWEDHDVLLTPTLAEPPLRLGELFEYAADDPLYPVNRAALFTPFTPVINLTGQPAASLPLAWTKGLPVGVQAIARPWDEATLFRLGAQLEAARPWADRRPPLS